MNLRILKNYRYERKVIEKVNIVCLCNYLLLDMFLEVGHHKSTPHAY